jgi:hypothetical protein
MQVNADQTIALPSPDPAGAGGQNRWDFLEVNCATPAASGGKSVCFVNTTNVDFFSLGLTVKGRNADGSLTTFGLDLSTNNRVASVLADLQALTGDYAAGWKTATSNGSFLRFLAPDLAFTSSSTALDSAITSGYNYYMGTPLQFTVGSVNYVATSNGNTLTFTQPASFTIAKPSTLNVIAATGPLNTGSTGDANIQGAMKFIAAYLNRGVFENTSTWSTPSQWYTSTHAYNQYSYSFTGTSSTTRFTAFPTTTCRAEGNHGARDLPVHLHAMLITSE